MPIHCCPKNSLSLPGEGWGEGIKIKNYLNINPLILAFSREGEGIILFSPTETSMSSVVVK